MLIGLVWFADTVNLSLDSLLIEFGYTAGPAGKKILGLRLWGGLAEAMLLAPPGLGWP